MANVYNLLPDCNLSNYDTVDGQSKEGILHETLRKMENKFSQRLASIDSIHPIRGEWLRAGIIKFDEMKVKEKL